MTYLRWSLHHARTGELVDFLPSARITNSVRKWVGGADVTTLAVPAKSFRNAQHAAALLDPRNRLLVVCNYDDAQPGDACLFGGVLRRVKWGYSGPSSANEVELTVMPVEMLLDEQYVCWDGVDADATGTYSQIAQQLGGIDRVMSFLPGAVRRKDFGPSNRYRGYRAKDVKTCRSVLDDLSNIETPIEWTIAWELAPNLAVNCYPTITDRLGRGLPADGTSPMILQGASWTIDWSGMPGDFSRIVYTYGDRPNDEGLAWNYAEAPLTSDQLPGMMIFHPDTGSMSADVLGSYARQRLAQVKGGLMSYGITWPIGRWRIGRDLDVGDLVRAQLVNPDLPALGRDVVLRMMGWAVDQDARVLTPSFTEVPS